MDLANVILHILLFLIGLRLGAWYYDYRHQNRPRYWWGDESALYLFFHPFTQDGKVTEFHAGTITTGTIDASLISTGSDLDKQ